MNLPTAIVIIVIAIAFAAAFIASRRHGSCDPASCAHCPHSTDGCRGKKENCPES